MPAPSERTAARRAPHRAETSRPKLPRAYGKEDIREKEGKAGLEVKLNRTPFFLEFRDVRQDAPLPHQPLWIAWLDPREPQLRQAAAQEVARRLVELRPRVVCTPKSSKSEGFITDAVVEAGTKLGYPIVLEVLDGAKTPAEAKLLYGRCSPGLAVMYHPVTSPVEPHYLGIRRDQVEDFRSLRPDPQQVIIVDDVYTTGETVRATRLITDRAMGLAEPSEFLTIVLAHEQPYREGYPQALPRRVEAFFIIPEIEGALPASAVRPGGL